MTWGILKRSVTQYKHLNKKIEKLYDLITAGWEEAERLRNTPQVLSGDLLGFKTSGLNPSLHRLNGQITQKRG